MAETTSKNNVDNISVGKPMASGAIFVAPKGTTMPTNGTATLSAAFNCIGYISEDGVVSGEARESNAQKAWGGTTVRKTQSSYEKTIKLTAIETENVHAAKLRYGSANVTAGADGKVASIRHNEKELDHWAMVVDMATSESTVTRQCYEDVQPTETADITYKDEDLIGFGMTLTAFPGSDGDVCKEYHAAVTSS